MAVVLVVTRVRTISIIRLSCVSIRIVPVSECHPRSARSTAASRLFSHSPSKGGRVVHGHAKHVPSIVEDSGGGGAWPFSFSLGSKQKDLADGGVYTWEDGRDRHASWRRTACRKIYKTLFHEPQCSSTSPPLYQSTKLYSIRSNTKPINL